LTSRFTEEQIINQKGGISGICHDRKPTGSLWILSATEQDTNRILES